MPVLAKSQTDASAVPDVTFKLHPRHVGSDGAISALTPEEVQDVVVSEACGGALGSEGPRVQIIESTLSTLDDGFDAIEVNILFAKISILDFRSGGAETAVLIRPPTPEFMRASLEESQGLAYASEVWIVTVAGASDAAHSGEDVELRGLQLLGRAGAIRGDFEESYEINDHVLGAGSHSTVFMVNSRDADDVQQVCPFTGGGGRFAVKVLNKPKSDDESARMQAKTRDEVGCLIAAQGHPNIIGFGGIFLVGEEEPHWALVMDCCITGNLLNYVARQQVGERQARRVTQGLLHALVHLHEKCGMVHRDVKPQNVLLSGAGEPVLCDFGLADRLPAQGVLTRRCGTPGYVAPEMLKHGRYGPKVDVFAAGCSLYFMFCRQPPFLRGSITATLRQTLHGRAEVYENPWLKRASNACKDAIQWLLRREERDRPHAREALRAPWFSEELEPGRPHSASSLEAVTVTRRDRKTVSTKPRCGTSEPSEDFPSSSEAATSSLILHPWRGRASSDCCHMVVPTPPTGCRQREPRATRARRLYSSISTLFRRLVPPTRTSQRIHPTAPLPAAPDASRHRSSSDKPTQSTEEGTDSSDSSASSPSSEGTQDSMAVCIA